MKLDVLDAINELVTDCALCGRELGEQSPSVDFCSEDCQEHWQRGKVCDPGGRNRAAWVEAIERLHPRWEAKHADMAHWPMHILGLPRDCPHCGTMITLVEAFHGGWGWMGTLGEPYEAKPGAWKLQARWHTPEQCMEAAFRRDQGVLW